MSVTPTSSAALSCSACAQGDDFGAVGRIETARVAVGHDAVADLHACGSPGSNGAGCTEIDVVRMGRETEDPPNPV